MTEEKDNEFYKWLKNIAIHIDIDIDHYVTFKKSQSLILEDK